MVIIVIVVIGCHWELSSNAISGFKTSFSEAQGTASLQPLCARRARPSVRDARPGQRGRGGRVAHGAAADAGAAAGGAAAIAATDVAAGRELWTGGKRGGFIYNIPKLMSIFWVIVYFVHSRSRLLRQAHGEGRRVRVELVRLGNATTEYLGVVWMFSSNRCTCILRISCPSDTRLYS